MAELTEQSIITPEERVYYNYGDLLIDLKHYIHNLNTNLNRFLDSRRNWSEGLKLVFKDRFEVLKQGLQQQLDSGEVRFNTGTDDIMNDSEGEISNGKNMVYVDSDGNTYSADDTDNTDGLTAFDVSRELGNFASKIAGAIAVHGYNKDYYLSLYDAKLKAALKKAAAEKVQAAAGESNAGTEGTSNAWDPSTQGLMATLKANSNIYDTTTNTSLNAIGLDNDFLSNWFSSVSPEERTAAEALQQEKEALAEKIQAVLGNTNVVLGANAPTALKGWAINNIPEYANRQTNTSAMSAFDLLANGVKLGPIPSSSNPTAVKQYLDNIEKSVVDSLKSGSGWDKTNKIVSNLLAYDKLLKSTKGQGVFLEESDGLWYLDYEDPSAGVAVVYDPNKKQVYLKKLIDILGTKLFDKIASQIISSKKLGGKLLSGGEIAQMNYDELKTALGNDPKAFNHANASFGWNSNGSTMSDENFQMEYEDYARIASLAANVGSIFADPGTGAAIGAGASLTDLTADLADESLSGWDAAKNFAANLGLDVVALIPGMESLKIARGIKTMAGMLPKALAAYGVLNAVQNGDEILTGIKNVASGNYSRADFLNAAQGIMLLAGAIKTGKTGLKNYSLKKANNPYIRVKLKDGTFIKVDGDIAQQIRANKKDLKKVNELVKEYLTGKGQTAQAVATRVQNMPIKALLPWTRGADGKIKGQSPLTSNVKADVSEIDVKAKGLTKMLSEDAAEVKDLSAEKKATTETPATETKATEASEKATVEPTELTAENFESLLTKELSDVLGKSKAKLDAAEAWKGKSKEVLEAKTKLETAKAELDKIAKSLRTPMKSVKSKAVEKLEKQKPLIFEEVERREKAFYHKINNLKLSEKELLEECEKYHNFLVEAREKIESINFERDAVNETIANNEAIKKKNEEEAPLIEELKQKDLAEPQRAYDDTKNALEELKKAVKEKTGWGEIKSQLMEGTYTIGDKKYHAPENVLKEIEKKYKLFNKEGGVLKMLEGGKTNAYDAVSEWRNTRYRSVWDGTKWVTQLRNNVVNTNATAPLNILYDPETGDEKLVTEREKQLQKSYDLLLTNEKYAKAWADQYKALNTAKGSSGHFMDGWYNKDGSFNFEGFKNSVTSSKGLKLWNDHKNGIGHDFFKGKTYYIKDSNGKETYYSYIPEGYTASTTGERYDDVLDKYLLNKQGKTTSPGNVPETESDEYEEPGFDEVNSKFGGKTGNDVIDPKQQITLLLLGKVPEIADYLRMRWVNKTEDKLTDMALKGTLPFLQDPYEVHRMVHGNYRAKVEGEKAAASLNALAAHPLTSDGALQTAALMEAKIKGLQYIDAGNKADDEMIQSTGEKSWEQEKDNVYNRWKIAMENRKSLAENLADRWKIRHAGESVKANNTDTYWKNVIANAKTEIENKLNANLAADIKDITTLATVNPSALGIQLTQTEQNALNAVVLGGMNYTDLPSDAYKNAFASAKRKINWATSNYARKYKGLSSSPFENAILNGLNEGYAEITTPSDTYSDEDVAFFKDGGSTITVAKIREKMKNADRRLKDVHKRIDSLDKKLDRISRSMYSIGKVALLR